MDGLQPQHTLALYPDCTDRGNPALLLCRPPGSCRGPRSQRHRAHHRDSHTDLDPDRHFHSNTNRYPIAHLNANSFPHAYRNSDWDHHSHTIDHCHHHFNPDSYYDYATDRYRDAAAASQQYTDSYNNPFSHSHTTIEHRYPHSYRRICLNAAFSLTATRRQILKDIINP